MNNLKNKAISSVKWHSIFTLINTIIKPVTLIFLARFLTTREFGFLSIISIIIGFSKHIAKMGFSHGIIKEDNLENEDLHSIFWFDQFLGIILFLLIFSSAGIIASFFNEPEIAFLVRVASFVFLFQPVDLIFRALLEKNLKYKLLKGVSTFNLFASNLSKIIFAALGYGALSYVIGNLIGILLLTVILFYLFYRDGLWLPKLYFSFSRVKPYLKFGIFISAKSILHNFSKRFDEILIGRLIGSESLGLYYFAKNIITRLYKLLSDPISRVSFPLLSKIKSDKAKFNRVYIRITVYLAIIGFPAFIGFAIVSPLAVPFVFGEEWNEAIIYVVILSIWGIIKMLEHGIISRALYCYDRSDYVFYISFADLLVRSVVIYFSLQHSIILMMMLFALVEFIKYIFTFKVLSNITGISLKKLAGSIYYYFIFAILMGLVVAIFPIYITIEPFYNLILSIIVGVVFYFAVFYIFKKNKLIEVYSLLKDMV